MRLLFASRLSRLHLRLGMGVVLVLASLFGILISGVTAKPAIAADNNGTSVTYINNGAGIRIIGENWAGRGWYSPESPDGLADFNHPGHIVLAKTNSNPVTYSGYIQATGGYVGSNLQPCAFIITIRMTSDSQGAVSGRNENLGGDCNATTIADLGLPATFRVSGDLPPEFADVDDSGVRSGNESMAKRWAQGDTKEITYATIDRYTDSEIREVCRILNDENSSHYEPGLYQLCVDNATDARNNAENDYVSNCAVEGIGWIVCPVMNFLSGVADGAYSVIENFLVVEVQLLSTNTGTYAAWSAFRNIANILFVVMFLVIIYSQLTSMGISNYGVKKSLPRLIVAALLVNTSFFICQLVVDITQIIGGSLASFLGNIPTGVAGSEATPTFSDVIGDVLMGTVLGVGAAAGIIGGVAVLALSISIPVLLAFLVAVLMTVIILIARQAAIVIMIVLAPLAFVAYLLPNTEQWFKRWAKMFWGLLIVYPIIALLYAGGKLAGNIIVNTANAAGVDGDTKFWMSLIGMGTAAIPLIMTPSLLRGAMNATGTLGTKLSGYGSGANRGIGSRVKDSTQFGRRLQEFNTGRERSRAAKAVRSRTSRVGKGVDSIINKVPGAGAFLGSSRGTILANEAENKLFDEEVGLQQTTMRGKDEKTWLGVMNNRNASSSERAAAAGLVMKSGSRKAQLQALEQVSQLSRNNDKDASDIQKQMYADMSSKPFSLGQSQAAMLRQGIYQGDISQEFNERLTKKLSPETLAGMDPDEIELAANMATNNQLSPAALGSLYTAIGDLRDDKILSKKITPAMNDSFNVITREAGAQLTNNTNTTPVSPTSTQGSSNGNGSTQNSNTQTKPPGYADLVTSQAGTTSFRGGEEVSNSGLIVPKGTVPTTPSGSPASNNPSNNTIGPANSTTPSGSPASNNPSNNTIGPANSIGSQSKDVSFRDNKEVFSSDLVIPKETTTPSTASIKNSTSGSLPSSGGSFNSDSDSASPITNPLNPTTPSNPPSAAIQPFTNPSDNQPTDIPMRNDEDAFNSDLVIPKEPDEQ